MKREIKGKACLLICLFVLTFIFLGLKCLITTKGTTDEVYYIATAYRFYQGDAMLVDDWNTAQMSGFLLLPFVHLYMLLMKTTEGIVLYFRFLYLIFKALTAAFCIVKLRKYGMSGIIAVSLYYFFSPQNLDALSYNTIALGMIIMIGAVCLDDARRKRDYYYCGIFLAVAVLAQPFCILIYFAGAVITVWKLKKGKHEDKRNPLRQYALVSAGAFTMLLIFSAFVFARASWQEVFVNLPFVLNDKNHNVSGMGGLLQLALKPLKVGYHILKNYTVLTIINTLYFFVVLAGRHYKKQYGDYLAYGAVICLILSCVAVMASGRPFLENEFFIPFIWFSAEQAVLISREKKKYYVLWGLSILCALSFCLSTDTGIISTSAGLCPMAVFSILMFPNMLSEGRRRENYLLALGAGLSCCVFVMRILCTWTNTLVTGDYTHRMEKGPLKGTYADEEWYYKFCTMMSDLDRISYTKDDILFCGRNTPLAYLYSGMGCGTMSIYLLDTDYERMEQYYTLHPDKFPTVVYYYPVGSYPVTERDRNSAFFRYIEANYEVLEVEGRILALRSGSKQ